MQKGHSNLHLGRSKTQFITSPIKEGDLYERKITKHKGGSLKTN